MVRGLPKLFLWHQVQPLCRVPSYASCRYNSQHAFRWINRNDELEHVRYSWVPEVPQERFRWWQSSWWRATRRDPDYLRAELADRLHLWPARFRLEAQVAEGRDRVVQGINDSFRQNRLVFALLYFQSECSNFFIGLTVRSLD